MKKAILDLVERVGWTFVQAAVGTLTASSLLNGHVDWRTVLVSAGVAGGVAGLKVLGINASALAALVPAVPVPVAAVQAEAPTVGLPGPSGSVPATVAAPVTITVPPVSVPVPPATSPVLPAGTPA